MKMSRVFLFLFIIIIGMIPSVLAEEVVVSKTLTVVINDQTILVNIGNNNWLFPKNQSATLLQSFNVSVMVDESEKSSRLSNESIASLSKTISTNMYNLTNNLSTEMIQKVLERNDKLEYNIMTQTKVAVRDFCDYEKLKEGLVDNITSTFEQHEVLTTKISGLEKDLEVEQTERQNCLENVNKELDKNKIYFYIIVFVLLLLGVIILAFFGTNIFSRFKENMFATKETHQLKNNFEQR